VPFLGICLGMQLAVIEFARNVLGMPQATSSEFDPEVVGTEDEAVLFMPEGDQAISPDLALLSPWSAPRARPDPRPDPRPELARISPASRPHLPRSSAGGHGRHDAPRRAHHLPA
jgi:hypothetical protein